MTLYFSIGTIKVSGTMSSGYESNQVSEQNEDILRHSMSQRIYLQCVWETTEHSGRRRE